MIPNGSFRHYIVIGCAAKCKGRTLHEDWVAAYWKSAVSTRKRNSCISFGANSMHQNNEVALHLEGKMARLMGEGEGVPEQRHRLGSSRGESAEWKDAGVKRTGKKEM